MNGITPRQLRYVLALAELGGFRRAAAFLAVPPGVLSREIAAVERACGTPLFERLARTAPATPAGVELAELARRALGSHVAGTADVSGEGVSLRVGWVDYGRGQAIQRAALAEFRAQYPRIPVQLATTPYRDQMRALGTGDLNAGFHPGPEPRGPGLAAEVMCPDTLACVMIPAGHPLAARELLALAELSGFPFHSLRADYAPEIVARIHDGVSRGGWRGRQTTGSAQPSEVMTAVACGGAWTPAPTDLGGWMPPGVEVRPLADAPLTPVDMHMVWREDDPVAGAFAALVRELREAIDAAVPRAAAARPAGGLLQARAHAEAARAEREASDALLQDILGSELQLEAVRRRLPHGLEEESRDLERVVRRLSGVARKGREVLEGLVPVRARVGGVEAALSIAAEELGGGSGAKFTIRTEGSRRELRPNVEESACWLGVEALTNAFRHAGASRVAVTLEYRPDRFRLRVADDGAGIDAAVLEAGGRAGLAVMRERAEAAGGTLEVRSVPGEGTRVEMEVPAASAFAHYAG
jgi:signal transduction histidine kinase